jgi:hypothetical protein
MSAIVTIIALGGAAGLWLWLAEDHELIEEMHRGRQAERPRGVRPGRSS